MATTDAASAAIDPAALRRARFYRELLTPLLHRRFTNAAGLVIVDCWLVALLIGDWSSFFWSWFPIGPAGVRTLLLFVAALLVFILRVAQIHFGLRTSVSPFDALRQQLLRLSTLQTLAIYLLSAWWFGEIYIWSASRGADLNWVAEGKSWERQRLNERQVFIRSHFLLLAVAQTVHHLYRDVDQVRLPLPDAVSDDGSIASKDKSSPLQKVIDHWLYASVPAVRRAVVFSFCNLFVYALLLRQTAWSWSLSFARVVYNVSKSSEPSLIPPYHYTLLIRSFTAGILLIGLWDMSNTIFTAYVAQEPLKKGKPLTDYARDHNGVLLNGLKSKKELVRTFAFQELYLISTTFATRRQIIYSDLERDGGSAWSQVLKASLGVVEDINTRIIDKNTPPPEMTLKTKVDIVPTGLPRLSAPLIEGTILSPSPQPSSRRERYISNAGEVAKYFGESKADASPLQKALLVTRDQLLTEEQQNALKPENISQSFFDALRQALRTPLGVPFRQLFAYRAQEKLLGAPDSDLANIIHAINAVTHLAVNSIKEDQFGTVNKDVALILRTFVNITGGIEKFVRQSPIHWTDVYFQEKPAAAAAAENNDSSGGGRHVEEIDQILAHLRASLKYLISSFERYAKDMGLGRLEMREARKAAGIS